MTPSLQNLLGPSSRLLRGPGHNFFAAKSHRRCTNASRGAPEYREARRSEHFRWSPLTRLLEWLARYTDRIMWLRADRRDLVALITTIGVACVMCPVTVNLIMNPHRVWLHGLLVPSTALLL